LPFLGGPPRLAVRAVKAAVFAFMGAQRTALTEEAGGLGAGFVWKGKGIRESLLKGDSRSLGFTSDCIARVLQNRNCQPPQGRFSWKERATEEGQEVCVRAKRFEPWEAKNSS
jgi:hypothetical protein